MTRDQLTGAILDFLAPKDPRARDATQTALAREIDAAGDQALEALKTRLTTDAGWGYSPPDPLARRIHRMLADRFFRDDSRVEGAEWLASLEGARVVFLPNHLSYADANVMEVLFCRAGADRLADRMTAIAGPKVFSDLQRRFSSLCFGTVKVPQSTEVSTGEAALNARDVARAARAAIDAAHARLDAGDALVLFAEGTRSRTAQMGTLLPGAARYLEERDTWLVPVGLTGCEALFPVDARTVQPARIVMRIGRPLRADALFAKAAGDRRIVMDALGAAIAALLPPANRGVYGEGQSEASRYSEA